MTVTLGAAPQAMSLILVRDGDFICTLVSADGDWPGTAVVSLVVGATTWTAAAVGPELRWNVDKAAVNTLIATSPKSFRLLYVDGTTDLVWGKGTVSVRG